MAVSDEDRIGAAQAYIDALVSHDAAAVPLAASCTRIEQGVKTGYSGNHLRRSLNRGPQYRVIAGTTPPAYRIVGDEVHPKAQAGQPRSSTSGCDSGRSSSARLATLQNGTPPLGGRPPSTRPHDARATRSSRTTGVG